MIKMSLKRYYVSTVQFWQGAHIPKYCMPRIFTSDLAVQR